MIDHTQSTISLAKTLRMGLEGTNTILPTSTVRLLLDTLIALGEPAHHANLRESAERSVLGLSTKMNEAIKAAAFDQELRGNG